MSEVAEPTQKYLHGLRPKLNENQFTQHVQAFTHKDVGRFRSVSPQEVNTWGELMDFEQKKLAQPVFDLPSPWSRAILFEMALYDPKHLLHQNTLAQWYGLWAIMGLQLALGLPLRAEPFSLHTSDLAKPDFAHLLIRLMPNLTIHPDINWQSGYFFWLEEQLIACSSPTTLFLAAPDLVSHPRIPWLSAGVLQNPIPHLKTWQKKDLLAWLISVDLSLREFLGNTYLKPWAQYVSSLESLLLAFIFALCQDVVRQQVFHLSDCENLDAFRQNYLKLSDNLLEKGKLFTPSPCNTTEWGEYRFRFEKIWAFLNLVPDTQAILEKDSPLRLLSSVERLPEKQILLIDPQLEENLALAQQWMVYEHFSLHELTEQIRLEKDQSWLGNRYLNESIWCRPDDFWTEELYLLPGYDSLPGVRDDIFGYFLEYGHAEVLPILPLQTFVLDYYTVKDLVERLSFERSGMEVTVYLTLTLAENRQHTLQKTYQLKAQNILSNLPVLNIWPNFASPLVHAYYSYYCAFNQEQHIFQARPWVPFQKPESAFYSRSRNLLAGEVQASAEPSASAQPDMEIWKLKNFPEAYLCEAVLGPQKPRHHAGILLLKPPIQIKPSSKKWEIAIDFGTTNTNIRLKVDGVLKQAALESERIFPVTLSSYDMSIYEDFLARETIHPPFLTLYKVKNLAQQDPLRFRILLDGHVYFVETIHTFEANNRLKTDLKWGQEEQRIYMLAFLQQLAMQVCLEALAQGAAALSFRFSYPLAFSGLDLKAFQISVSKALSDLKQHFSPAIEPEPVYFSEGVAAAYYYAQGQPELPKALFHRGVVILDIGGGTTDITIIEGPKNEVRFTSSLKFAGRDIFLQALLQHPHVLKELDVESVLVKKIAEEAKKTSLPSPQLIATVDALIHEYEEKIFSKLRYNFGLNKVVDFVARLAFAVGGIFYHVGQVICYLQSQGRYLRKDMLPMFFIAGNGAKLFHWFTRGTLASNPYYDLFQEAFCLMGDSFLAPIEQPLEIFISSTAQRSKPEVVEGMLVERGLLSLLESQALRPSFVAGEQFQLANEQDDSNQTLRLLNRDELEFLIPESIQINAFANYSQGYNDWLRSLHPSAVIADQKIQQAIKKTQQHVQAHVRDLQAKIAQDARFKHGIRDEQVLFLSALKFYYLGLLKR